MILTLQLKDTGWLMRLKHKPHPFVICKKQPVKDSQGMKVEEGKKTFQTNEIQKKTGMDILRSENVDFMPKLEAIVKVTTH
jgi:hypothetical protein